MRVDWDKMGSITAFIVMLTVMRLLLHQFDYNTGHPLPELPDQVRYSMWTFGLVFWEDMFFGVPIYFLLKYMKNRKVAWAIIVALSALFGMGHLYQGPMAAFALSFAPYFISYQIGRRYGFGTSMCAHILYDTSTAYLVKLLPYLIQ